MSYYSFIFIAVNAIASLVSIYIGLYSSIATSLVLLVVLLLIDLVEVAASLLIDLVVASLVDRIIEYTLIVLIFALGVILSTLLVFTLAGVIVVLGSLSLNRLSTSRVRKLYRICVRALVVELYLVKLFSDADIRASIIGYYRESSIIAI